MKNTHILSISLVAVSAAFVIISVLVAVTGGKNKYLIAKKLRLGAIIIGMTCMANGCRPVVTCYDPAPMPVLTCTDSVNNDGLIILHRGDRTINFDCQYLYYENVSYQISNDTDDLFSGDCVKSVTDSTTSLLITTAGDMNLGTYKLKLFYLQAVELDENSSPFSFFDIKVIE